MKTIYDHIGTGYTKYRCADPRIVEKLADLIGLSSSLILADIGAGTGNYSCAITIRCLASAIDKSSSKGVVNCQLPRPGTVNSWGALKWQKI